MKIYEQKLIGAKSDPQTQQNGIRANKLNESDWLIVFNHILIL